MSIDDSQFGFVPGRGTTDVVFVVWQLQEKYLAVNKRLYIAFMGAVSMVECVRRLFIWKEAMEKKGLRVNAGKTKVMLCGTGLDLLHSSGKYSCAVCCTGVCKEKCSGLQRLTLNPDYRCARCRGTARPIDDRPQSEVQVRA